MMSPTLQDAYQAFLAFLTSDAERNTETAKDLLSGNVSGFGTGTDEIILNSNDASYVMDREYQQIPQPTRFKLKLLLSQEISDSVCLFMALVTREIMFTDNWEKYEPIRYSALLQRDGSNWKILHLHISASWKEQQEGEAYPLQLLAEKNLLLNEAVKEKTRELREALSLMETLATIDKLTGTYNRHKFEKIAEHELARARRYKHPLSLILMDMDHFKRVNDTHGHLIGDQVLQQTAHIIKHQLREVDTLARWGGEEFIVLLPDQALPEAVLVAERIRKWILINKFEVSNRVSISMGIAQYQPGEGLDDMLRRADRLLYQAKRRGRNRVVWKDSNMDGTWGAKKRNPAN